MPLCGEPQAAQGTCSSVSQIGHTTVGAGAGPTPIFLPVAGQPPNPVYLTTGYKGARHASRQHPATRAARHACAPLSTSQALARFLAAAKAAQTEHPEPTPAHPDRADRRATLPRATWLRRRRLRRRPLFRVPPNR